MPDRQPEGKRNTKTTIIVVALVAAAFLIYLFGYGFGPFFTDDGQDIADDVPTTEQPADDVAADEPAEETADTGAGEAADTATPPADEQNQPAAN